MVNETFDSKRFGRYFRYDISQFWHNNGKAALLLGFLSVITYLLWVGGSLVFTGTWSAPSVAFRLLFFSLGFFALVLYQTRTYGYLTEKRAGQSWLMLPASTLEKFISMMIITILVIPCAYVVSYLALDSLIGLLDPTAGGLILTSANEVMDGIGKGLSAASEEGFQINLMVFILPLVLQFILNLLYFLLCGITFKKWKILGGIGVILGFQMVFTPIMSTFVFKYWTPILESQSFGEDPIQTVAFVNNMVNYATITNAVVLVALAVAIYYRLKTLKH